MEKQPISAEAHELVKKDLAQLHNSLQNDDLQQISEINDLLEKIEPVLKDQPTVADDYHHLAQKLGEAVQTFECAHPTIAAQIRVVINSLNDIGI